MTENSNSTPIASNRLQWLDAMRGFTMILVVTYHVSHISFGMDDRLSSAQPLLVLFRMPLFFFVSGFLAPSVAKLSFSWLTKKVRIQLLPTLFFMVAYILLFRHHFFDTFLAFLRSATKGGYWFTWTLLLMFVEYYVANLKKTTKVAPILFFFHLILYALIYMPPVMKWVGKDVQMWLDYTSLIQLIRYMPFFLFGVLVKQNWNRVQRLMDTRWFFPLMVLVAFWSAGDFLRWHILRKMWANIPHTLAAFSLLLMVVMFFRRYELSVAKDKKVGKILQFIGTRTLDIYLLHYFFLPRMAFVGKWLNVAKPGMVVELLMSVSGALIVIAFCCLVSSLLRVSPLLSKYLFGVKYPNPA